VEGSHGQLKPAQQLPVSPLDYQIYTGQDPQLWFCLSLMIVGFAVVWLIHTYWRHD
jgi:putative membrane protein